MAHCNAAGLLRRILALLESIQVVDSLAGIDPGEWNALAGGQPFVRHEFLSALLETRCASARTGWLPQFLILRHGGVLAGAMPLFAKTHSYGEYVFDWAWADAYERNGLQYYPKLLSAIPFTPVRGTRLLSLNDESRETLARAALELAKQTSSLHVLFIAEREARILERCGMLLRRTVQFCWSNEQYGDFEQFLAKMSHSKRKNIRQERRRVREAGVTCRWLEGSGIEPAHWEFFNRCYRHTYSAHRSSPYLSSGFFLELGRLMPESVRMVIAERDARPIAAALFLADETTLYGRHWGAIEHVPLVHFECCYYQAIEYAIAKRLTTFEGGAQGEHKLFRGLLPVEAASAHWLGDARFSRAVEEFLAREAKGVTQYVDELSEHTPFKA
jgi:uncharacterized protein